MVQFHVPDSAGLSEDSLRGSQIHVMPTLVNNAQGTDHLGNDRVRDELSPAEVEALRQTGVFVNPDGSQMTDWDEIKKIAPPNFSAPATAPAYTASGQPTGYWADRNGEWVFFGDRPPVLTPQTAPASLEDSARPYNDPRNNPSDDAGTHFMNKERTARLEAIQTRTTPFLNNDPTPPPPSWGEESKGPGETQPGSDLTYDPTPERKPSDLPTDPRTYTGTQPPATPPTEGENH